MGKSRYKVVDKRHIYQPVEVDAYSGTDARLVALPLLLGKPVTEVLATVVERLYVDLVATVRRDPENDHASLSRV
jgi:hypothetical protein